MGVNVNELGRFPFLSNHLTRVFPHLSALIFPPKFRKIPNYGLPRVGKKKCVVALSYILPKPQTILVVKIVYNLSTILTRVVK